jgi:flagellar hook-associated protein FlgK
MNDKIKKEIEEINKHSEKIRKITKEILELDYAKQSKEKLDEAREIVADLRKR